MNTLNVYALLHGFTDERQPVLVHHPKGRPPGGLVAGSSEEATPMEVSAVLDLVAAHPRRHSHVLHFDRATMAPAGEFRMI